MNSRLTRCLLLLFVCALLGELTVRVGGVASGKTWALPPGRAADESPYQPHPFIGYTVKPSTRSGDGQQFVATTNRLGFRGEEIAREKPERTFRIACLGGSTTWSTGASTDARAWPAVLQRRLNAALPSDGPYDRVEVINAGVSGYTLMESFINLKMRVLPLDPDLVIVYHAVNDAQVIRRAGFQPDYSHVRRSWKDPEPPSGPDRLFSWSHLYGLFAAPDERARRETINERLTVDDYEQIPLRPARETAEGLETFRWTLRETIALSRLHGAEVALASFAWADNGLPPKDVEMVKTLKRINAVIGDVAREQETALLDLHREGPRQAGMFDDLVHFNDAGNRLAGLSVARSLLRSGLLGPGSTPPLATATATASR